MIEQFYYLAILVVSLAGLAIIDWRHKLAFWHNRKRTLLTVGIGVAVFTLWDIAGIGLGIFRHGNSPYTLPLRLGLEFPLEELLFLTLLCYVTLILFQGGKKLWSRI
jgi:lycopene cyclase domain-containing protein